MQKQKRLGKQRGGAGGSSSSRYLRERHFSSQFFSNVELYINKQQFHISNGLYASRFYISNNFKGAISERQVVLHCEGYNYEEFFVEILQAPLPQLFPQVERKNIVGWMVSCRILNYTLSFSPLLNCCVQKLKLIHN